MVCDVCLTIFKQIGDGVTNGKINHSNSYIERGREEGCIICMRAQENNTKANHLELKFRFQPLDDALSTSPPFGGQFLSLYILDPNFGHSYSFVVEILRDYYEGRPYIPPESTGDHEALSIARSWLQDCLSSHTQCKSQAGPGFVPPRLLDLRNDKISLASNFVDTFPPQYVTLSHCWGPKPDSLKLCYHNKRQFEDVVPVDALPKTFMDAVYASRQFGFDFLWIDSLFIVQEGPGSKEDWLRHVKIMKLIYQNAVLNLSADASENANEGLFRHRNQQKVLTPRVCVKGSALEGKYIIYTGLRNGWNPPLGERGWVLQERLFSNRILHFGSEQLEWECNDSSDISERYPYKLNGSWAGLGTYSNDTFRMIKTDSSKPQANFLELVMDYTRCQLTYPALDKFAAFSAISEHFSNRLGQLYQAGFLQKSLPFSLLWCLSRSTDGMEPTQPSSSSPFRAPSWSWASLDDPVHFYNCNDMDQIIGDHHSCSPISYVQSLLVNPLDPSNPFGRLKEAKITLATSISTCQWRMRGDTRNFDSLLVPEFPTPEDELDLMIEAGFDNVEDIALPFDQVNVIAVYFRNWYGTKFQLYILLIHRTVSTEYRRIGAGFFEWPYRQGDEAKFLDLKKRNIIIV